MGLGEVITAPVIEYIEARNKAMEKAIKFAEEEKGDKKEK